MGLNYGWGLPAFSVCPTIPMRAVLSWHSALTFARTLCVINHMFVIVYCVNTHTLYCLTFAHEWTCVMAGDSHLGWIPLGSQGYWPIRCLPGQDTYYLVTLYYNFMH